MFILFVFLTEKKNGLKIIICRKCHDKLESNILAVESFVGNVAYGTRYKLYKESYEKILNKFVNSTKLNYVSR